MQKLHRSRRQSPRYLSERLRSARGRPVAKEEDSSRSKSEIPAKNPRRRSQPKEQHHMSKKVAEHHLKAAEHLEHAARHHKEAAKHHEAGNHEKAAHHAHIARAHHEHAHEHAVEAAKAHAQEHGSK